MMSRDARRAATVAVVVLVGLGPVTSCSDAPSRPASSGAPSSVGTTSAVPSTSATPARTVPAAALRSVRKAVHGLVGGPGSAPVRARLVDRRVQSWRSADDFTLLVTLSLHFPTADTGAWSEGTNERFVHVTRSPGADAYQLTWATSP